MADKKRLIYLEDALAVMPALEMCTRALRKLPTVDAVEVVPCKDCVHRKERVCCNPSAGMWVGVELKDSDFCSYGERRAGE